MENASKALIMAGAILIALLIISLSILIFNNFGGAAKEAANMDEQQIKAFNAQLTPYLGNNVSGSQVNTLLQRCLSINIAAQNSGETYKCITVNVNGTERINGTSNTFQRVDTNKKYYTVVGTYDDNGLLTTISITG